MAYQSRMLDRRATALLAGLCSLLGATRASAQASPLPGLATAPLDRFEPSPAGDAFFAVPSAAVAGELRPAVGVTWTYARDPLVLRTLSGRTAPLRWVDHQTILHAQASLQLFQRVELDIDFPLTLGQGGTTGSLSSVSVTAPSGATFNDVRAGGRVVLLRQNGGLPAASLAFSAWFPTGDAESFAGGGTARYAPSLIVSADYRRFLWSATLGRRFQRERVGQLIGSQLFVGAAAAFRWQKLQIGPELSLSSGVGDTVSPLANNLTAAEILLGARYGLGPVTLGVGAGPGLGQGVGTPSYRLFASLSWAVETGSPGSGKVAAGDGRGDAGAKTATLPPGPPKPLLPAPAPDLDGDGVPDADDQCPTVSGDARPEAFRRGCPADRDRDGVYDLDDHCPDVPGAPSDDPAKNGCPLDTDGDGILDAQDACPAEKGNPTSDPKTNGCPDAVRIQGTQIIILQQVNFETARDEIKADSFGLLGQVAAVLAQHPEIARLAVDGHTDSRGAEKANTNLSQRRALAVVRWLTDHGIDARRLEARGFGPRRPIADNTSDAGRAKNRRVEFLIRKRTLLGEAGWKDGPVE
jgi:outer membrane protein OmpA-like peptidoglycan-associated protein